MISMTWPQYLRGERLTDGGGYFFLVKFSMGLGASLVLDATGTLEPIECLTMTAKVFLKLCGVEV